MIESLVLKKLKSDGELKLGVISKAVITVPAYFNEDASESNPGRGEGLPRSRFLTLSMSQRRPRLRMVFKRGSWMETAIRWSEKRCWSTIWVAERLTRH